MTELAKEYDVKLEPEILSHEIRQAMEVFLHFDLFRCLGNHAMHLLEPPVLNPPPHPGRDQHRGVAPVPPPHDCDLQQFQCWGVEEVIRSPGVNTAITSVCMSRKAISFLQLGMISDLPLIKSFGLKSLGDGKHFQRFAEGSFANVYKGRWMNGDKSPEVVFKCFKRSDEDDVVRCEQDWWKEAELLLACNHPNIVNAIALICDDSNIAPGNVAALRNYALVMEVCDYSLRDLLAQFDPPKAQNPQVLQNTMTKLVGESEWFADANLQLKILRDIASGLSYLHKVPRN